MPWSLVGAQREQGQGGGAFNYPVPAGVLDGDLIVVGTFASGSAFGILGLDATSGFTVGPTLAQAVVPALYLATGAKIASSEPATYAANEGVGTVFMATILAVYRWTGGAASIADLTAFRGTTGIVQDTVSPVSFPVGAYTPGDTDNLGIYFAATRQSNSGGHASLATSLAIIDSAGDYDDFGVEYGLGHEVVATSFPGQLFEGSFVAPSTSASGVAGRLANEVTLPTAPGFGFGTAPFGPA